MKQRLRKRLMLCGAAIAGLAVPVCTALILLLMNHDKPGLPDGTLAVTGARPGDPAPTRAARPALPMPPVIVTMPAGDNPPQLAPLGMSDTAPPAGDLPPPAGFAPTIPPGATPASNPQNRRTGAPGHSPHGAPGYLTAGGGTPAGGAGQGNGPGGNGGGGAPADTGGTPPADGSPGGGPNGNTPPETPAPIADAGPPAGPQGTTPPAGHGPGQSPTPPSGGTPPPPPAAGPGFDPDPAPQAFQDLPLETIGLPVESDDPINAVPEPGVPALLVTALAALGLSRRRRHPV